MTKFSDLPAFLQNQVLSFLDHGSLTNISQVNGKLANVTSQYRTHFWTKSKQAAGWINLMGSIPPDLKLQFFETPRLLLRTDIRSPEIISRVGFRRRGKKPQFIPQQPNFNQYLNDNLKGKINESLTQGSIEKTPKSKKLRLEQAKGNQFPWDTMISTFDFDKLEESQFEKALSWEIYSEDEEINHKWIYFVLGDLGVITKNSFDEISLLGVLPDDIIAAVRIDESENYKYNDQEEIVVSTRFSRITHYWFNPNLTDKKFNIQKLKDSVEQFIHQIQISNPRIKEHINPPFNLAYPDKQGVVVDSKSSEEESTPISEQEAQCIIIYLHGLMAARNNDFSTAKFYLESLDNSSFEEAAKFLSKMKPLTEGNISTKDLTKFKNECEKLIKKTLNSFNDSEENDEILDTYDDGEEDYEVSDNYDDNEEAAENPAAVDYYRRFI